jgi:hypothetical protein
MCKQATKIVSAKCLAKSGKKQYCFTDVGSMTVCLMYGDTVSIFKVFNAKSHFTSKHEGQCTSLHSDATTRKAKELVLNLKTAAKYFTSKTSEKKQVL